MSLIKTAGKEKLPKGFSYPLGAEAISAALEGIPQLSSSLLIWFTWRDEFWVSRWRKRLQARGPFVLFRLAYSDYFSRWEIHVYSVPSDYTIFARQRLQAELPLLRTKLLGPRPPKSSSVTLILREAEANQASAGDCAVAPRLQIARPSRAAPDRHR